MKVYVIIQCEFSALGTRYYDTYFNDPEEDSIKNLIHSMGSVFAYFIIKPKQ